jgi:mannosyltransferase
MLNSVDVGKRRVSRQTLLALILITIGIAIKLWLRLPVDFWEDEIIAATHANQPLRDVIIDTIRNDVHPPLYFVQLHFWQLLGQSDIWLIINSVIWSMIGAASLWWVARQHFGEQVGIISCAVYGIMPSTAYMANQLRMYAMLAVLVIWAFHLVILIFKNNKTSALNTIALMALLIAIVITHAIGIIAVASSGLYALTVMTHRRALRLWALIYGVTAIASLPWLLSGMLHDANLYQGAGVFLILQPVASSVLGILANHENGICAMGAIVFIGVVTYGLSRRQTLSVKLCFLVFPIALAFAALVYKPIFKWNFFSTAMGPFMAIVIATMCADRRRLWALCGITCLAALLGTTLYQRLTFQETSGYLNLSRIIKDNYKLGDIVYVPQQSNFWGIARYVIGPNWGSPLRIAARPSAQWQKVYSFLGPKVVTLLGLMPDTQVIDRNGYFILTGSPFKAQPLRDQRIWMVTVPRADLQKGYPPEMLDGMPARWRDTQNTWITLYAAQAQKVVIPPR